MYRTAEHNIDMNTVARPITFEDSLTLPEDKCEEIIDGLSRHMPPASYEHAGTVKRAFLVFATQLDPAIWTVEAFGSGQLIQRDPLTYRIPDLAINRRQGFRTQHYITSTPELIIEVISPSNRKGDLNELLDHYALIGVPEVLFLHLDRRELVRHRLESSSYERAPLSSGVVEVLGIKLRISDLWETE